MTAYARRRAEKQKLENLLLILKVATAAFVLLKTVEHLHGRISMRGQTLDRIAPPSLNDL
jgi:hypothetical protein